MKKTLQKDLKMRHMTMISIGGVIGAGLFVGSGPVIQAIGPASVVSYAMAGVLIIFIMRMLGEMAVAKPTVGSFSEYARLALGEWAGFLVGWMYWYFWVIVVAVEATAGAATLQNWLLPHAPLWLLSLFLLVLLTLTNVFSVRSYGEFEYWFASIKVVAIILFLIIGFVYVFGLWPHTKMDFSNLTAHGGFAPKGTLALFSGVTTLIFSFFGSEIVTIAAAESEAPQRSVAKATSSVIWRVLFFYIGSIFLIVTILPWNDAKSLVSPYVTVLGIIGIPGAKWIMNLIIVTAVLSCLNSGLYTASRMLFALANRGDAPKRLLSVNRRGVPVKAILTCTIIGFLSVIMDYVSPEHVFLFLLNSSGAVGLFIYLFIACSQLRLRKKLEQQAPGSLQVRMWLYPYLTYLCILAMVAVIISMAFTPGNLVQLEFSLLSVVILLILYAIKRKMERSAKTIDPNIDTQTP